MTINRLYYFPYIKEYLGYAEEWLSFFPMITSLIILAILIFVLPAIKNKSRILIFAALFNIAGALLLILPLRIPFGVLLLNVVFWALSRAFLGPVLKSMIANEIDDNLRANVMSCYNVVSAVCLLPAGALGGFLYEISPQHPFYFVLAVYIAAFLPYAAYIFRAGKPKEINNVSCR
jgi:MFS family permease